MGYPGSDYERDEEISKKYEEEEHYKCLVENRKLKEENERLKKKLDWKRNLE